MTVYVDELRCWPTNLRCFKAGSAHLTADTLVELHAFAEQLKLRLEWFQDRPGCPHYDLTRRKHRTALLLGAVFKSARGQARERIKQLRKRPALYDCGCSYLKVGAGMCDVYDEHGKEREAEGEDGT